MSKVLQLGTVILAVIASLFFATAVLAQMPQSPWKKAAHLEDSRRERFLHQTPCEWLLTYRMPRYQVTMKNRVLAVKALY